MRSRVVRWLAVLLLGGLGGGVAWIYAHPPLRSWGHAVRTDEHWRTFAIDLSNEGWWPLILTGVTVDGEPLKPPFAVAAANYLDGEVASSVLMRLEERGHLLESGPVPGWRMAPLRDVHRFTYAVRLLRKPEAPPGRVIISYRYLGLPMRLTVEEES